MRVSFLPVDHPHVLPPVCPPEQLVEELASRVGQPDGILTHSGRDALDRVLRHHQFGRTDEVWVVTTSDLPNVSSCVTCTIFNLCKPSRVLTENTRGILIIHEFGAPHPRTEEFCSLAEERGLLVIEDCAHTLQHVGSRGHYALVSFPKLFPTAAGGALLGRDLPSAPTPPQSRRWLADFSAEQARRRQNYARLAETLPAWVEPGDWTPFFFPLPCPDPDRIQARARQRGVDCARWHGSDLVVLPCHHLLEEADLQRIVEVCREH